MRSFDARVVRQKLEDLHRAGVMQLPRPRYQVLSAAEASGERPEATGRRPLDNPPTNQQKAVPPAPPPQLLGEVGQASRSSETREQCDQRLAQLNERVKQCRRCEELCSTRTQTVFGVGNSATRLCFFGEAPGADEDRQGEPFVGRAGQLLDRIIEACTLRREDVYILNVLKCRPPGNRNPAADEMANCRPYFEEQLEIIQPEFICCLGSVAATTLLETKQPIGRLRGKFHTWHGIRVLATYHPAYLLRNPAAKAEVWKDMQMLMREMGIEIPKRGNN